MCRYKASLADTVAESNDRGLRAAEHNYAFPLSGGWLVLIIVWKGEGEEQFCVGNRHGTASAVV